MRSAIEAHEVAELTKSIEYLEEYAVSGVCASETKLTN